MSTATTFLIHDVSSFPLVRMKGDAMTVGQASQWKREMEALVSMEKPFVVLHGHAEGDESPGDRRERGRWLRHHRDRLSRHCLGIIGVEADAVKRLTMKVVTTLLSNAFRVPAYVVETEQEARVLAARLLGPQNVGDIRDGR